MRKADIYILGERAGELVEEQEAKAYRFCYAPDYQGLPVSLTMPVTTQVYHFDRFPTFLEGLLPEGSQLEGLLRHQKIDQKDYFSQLLAVGGDMVGALTVKAVA